VVKATSARRYADVLPQINAGTYAPASSHVVARLAEGGPVARAVTTPIGTASRVGTGASGAVADSARRLEGSDPRRNWLGTRNRDGVTAVYRGGDAVLLAGGEFVVKATSAQRYASVLPQINAGTYVPASSHVAARLPEGGSVDRTAITPIGTASRVATSPAGIVADGARWTSVQRYADVRSQSNAGTYAPPQRDPEVLPRAVLGRVTTGTVGGSLGGVSGGWIGNGTWNRDSVAAEFKGGGTVMLAGGEFVVKATSAQRYADVLPQINAGTYSPPPPNVVARLADGGPVGRTISPIGVTARPSTSGTSSAIADAAIREASRLIADSTQRAADRIVRALADTSGWSVQMMVKELQALRAELARSRATTRRDALKPGRIAA